MGLGSSGSHFGSRKIEIWYFYFFSASFCFKLITLQICCATKGSQPKRPAEQIVDSSFLFWNICLRKNLGLSWPLKLNFLPDIFLLFRFLSFELQGRLQHLHGPFQTKIDFFPEAPPSRQPIAVSDISVYICLIDIRSKSKEQLNERRAGLSNKTGSYDSTPTPLDWWDLITFHGIIFMRMMSFFKISNPGTGVTRASPELEDLAVTR